MSTWSSPPFELLDHRNLINGGADGGIDSEVTGTILPEELMIEILSRVESSVTLQLRCVSKLWKSLILNPQFLKKHILKSFTDIILLFVKALKKEEEEAKQ
ncbi:F-box-like protein [Medicago truncatula]|uniref:F-box-like protein n=1 Tax=Medicago truncatula TaxID=3880 RepID=G7IKG0_MEDTR|nr:F-box-like protein [Medicago truncatula]